MRDLIDAYFHWLALLSPSLYHPMIRDAHRHARLTAGFPIR